MATLRNRSVPLCCYSLVLLVGWAANVLLVQGAVLTGSDLNVMTYTGEDTAVVGSGVREVRAAVPNNIRDLLQDDTKKAYVYTYGDDSGDDKAYRKRSKDDGNSGYKHFDSYHKKDGDKYGYAKHTAYGQSKDDKADATNQKDAFSISDGASNEGGEDNDGVAKSAKRKPKKAPKQTADGTKHSYRVVEELDDDDGAHYTDGASSADLDDHHVESEGYSANESDDSGSEGDSGHYTAEDGESNSEADSEHYEAEAEGGDEAGDAAESEHYEEGGAADVGNHDSEGYTNHEDGAGDGEAEHYEAEADADYY